MMELFPVEYGRDLIERHRERFDDAVVVTQPEVWPAVETRIGPATPRHVEIAHDLTPGGLERLVDELPEAPIVGVGGGVAMDVAKWVHWRRQTPLTQVPGLPSVNACFTRMTAIRDGGIVRYDGGAVPDLVLVDFELMRTAPIAMIRAGIGDVLSCHTARFDWELAVAAGNDPAWDEEAAAASLRYISNLAEAAPAIHDATDEGIEALMELHREIGWRCHDLGHARFEEGSEHFFAYCFEEVTGRTILHGEIVSLGVIAMSLAQDNRPQHPLDIIRAAGTRHRLDDLGLTWDEVETTLRRLPAFAQEGRYWDSIAQRFAVTDDLLDNLRQAVS
ncbi:MAG: iron-containing alcohol dehydrogenase [Acidimicrobiia bacterium]|nr:iron-containing alcohol dehydrogenase [Acidimicrobiia bacterium]